jgi:hypothetical protein
MSAMSDTTSGPAGCRRKAPIKSPFSSAIADRVMPHPGQSTPNTHLNRQTPNLRG